MERQPSYILKPSLKEMSLSRVAAALWKKSDIYPEIGKIRRIMVWGKFEYDLSAWHQTVELNITERMSKLPLPKMLLKQLKPIFKSVGLEILKWYFFHERYICDDNLDFNENVFEKLIWTTAGVLDYRKTATEIVSSDIVDVVKRFDLSNLYYLEEYIPVLWDKISAGYKRNVYNFTVETPQLELFLPYLFEREKSKLDCFNKSFIPSNFFEHAALLGHKTLAEYCFHNLTKEEREVSLVRTAKDVIKFQNEANICRYNFFKYNLSDVACYLLSQMTLKEQMEVFNELPCEVLECFLNWPWKYLFLDVFDVVWTFLPKSKYESMVLSIYVDESWGYFQNFYQNVFLRSPIVFRNVFAQHFFEVFVDNKDTETMKLIYENVSASGRRRLLTTVCCLIYYHPNKWHVVEEFLREANPSKKNRQRMKRFFTKLSSRRLENEGLIDEYAKFFNFLDNLDK